MNIPYPKSGEWASIPGCAGYEASTEGEIRRTKNGRILRRSAARNGVIKVNIGSTTRTVRDLVARTFFGRPMVKGYRVENANGDLSDNCIENLVWIGHPALAGMQPRTVAPEIESAYEKAEADRLALIGLMQ